MVNHLFFNKGKKQLLLMLNQGKAKGSPLPYCKGLPGDKYPREACYFHTPPKPYPLELTPLTWLICLNLIKNIITPGNQLSQVTKLWEFLKSVFGRSCFLLK
jgi:hypothetical protein